MRQEIAVWGGDRARPRLARPMAVLGSDPDVVYVIGERDGAVLLETWGAGTGVRLGVKAVARGAQLRCEEAWRGSDWEDVPDDVVIALRTMDRNEIVTLDLATGSAWTVKGVSFGARVLATAPGGRFEAVDDDEEVSAALAGGRRVVCGRRDQTDACAVERNGRFVAWRDRDDGRVHLDGDGRGSAQVPAEGRGTAAFSERGDALWGAFDGEVFCWAVPSMEPLGRWTGASRDAELVAVSNDGRSALLDGPVAFEVGAGGAVPVEGRSWAPHLARLAPYGERLALGPGTVLGWHDLARGERVELHTGGHAGAVLSIAVSPDGGRVATAAADRSIRVCDAATGEAQWVLEGDAEGFCAVAFAPDGQTLYAATNGHVPRLTAWSLRDGSEVTPARLELPPCGRLEVSPDGTRLAAAGLAGGGFALVDVTRFEVMGTTQALSGASASFAPDGRALYAAGAVNLYNTLLDGAEQYDPARAEVIREESPESPFGRVFQAGYSPGARWLLTGGRDDDDLVVHLHDVADGYRARVSLPLSFQGRPTASAAGATRAAISGPDGVVDVLEYEQRTTRRLGDPLRTRVTALALSRDERTLYVGTENGQVRVWSLEE